MSIKEFIQQNTLLPRLKKNSVLVVYDPDKIYHGVCLDMATDTIEVVDASNSSITSRESALKVLKKS